MTLRHGNRIRRSGGSHLVRELQSAEVEEPDKNVPTDAEIQQRAHEIHLGRNGVPGNAVLDWLQAEMELRSRKAHAPAA